MFYELRITLFTDTRPEFDDIIDKIDDLKPQLRVVNPDQDNMEPSVIDLMENHHDVNPHEPCKILEHWDNKP